MEAKPHPYLISDEVWMVPCISNKEGNQFQPLCQPFNSNVGWEELQIRHPWTAREDELLKTLTGEKGTKAWSAIAKELNNRVHNGASLRRGKQCRERYYNHLNMRLNKGEWLKEEDQMIVDMQEQIGNKWSEIAKQLTGRTENQVKNRWKSLQKKLEKKSKVKNEECRMISPLISITPNSAIGFVPYNYELGFSSLADNFRTSYGFGERSVKKDNQSPSSVLFFSPE